MIFQKMPNTTNPAPPATSPPCESCLHRRVPTLWDFKLHFSFCKKFHKPCLSAITEECAPPHPGFQIRN